MKSFPTRIIILSFLLTFIIINPLHAAPERRIALVIGNSTYSSGPLKNPVNDATDIAATLRRLGFSVIIKKNASQRVMEESIQEFGNKLKKGGVGLFYYAGHGLQVNGVNYLIPVAAKINQESDVKYEAIDTNKVLDEMANANNGLNIVILDACRDNPFTRSFRNATRGLAIVSSAPVGTFISYSTGPGNVARDGEGRNSPYAEALSKYMKEPGLTIEQVFKKVRAKLDRETGNKQIPWELSSLRGDFFFSTAKSPATRPSSEETSQVAVLTPPPESSTDSTVQNDKYFPLLARKGWNDALDYFQKAVASSPDDMDARAGLAIALVFKGYDDNAKYNIRRIKEANYESKWTRVAIGLVEGLGQDYESGRYQLNRAIEEGVDKALAYLCLGMIDSKRGNREQVKEDLDHYKTLVSADEQGTPYRELVSKIDDLIQKGNALINGKKWNEALEVYNKAIEIKPDYAEAFYQRGIAYANLGNYQQAIADYTRAIELKPDYVEAYFNRGGAYVNLGDTQQAITNYTKAIELKPNFVMAYYWRGHAYIKLKNHLQARADFTKAIELKTNFADAYYWRGATYYLQQDYREAITNFTKAIELNPRFVRAYTGRATSYLNLNNNWPNEQIISDEKTAASLGDREAQEYLRKIKGKTGLY